MSFTRSLFVNFVHSKTKRCVMPFTAAAFVLHLSSNHTNHHYLQRFQFKSRCVTAGGKDLGSHPFIYETSDTNVINQILI